MHEYVVTLVIRENDYRSAYKAAEGIADSAEAIILFVSEVKDKSDAPQKS